MDIEKRYARRAAPSTPRSAATANRQRRIRRGDRVDRTVGAVGLAGRQHPVGYHYAGRRVTVRIDQRPLQLVQDGVLLRSLPNPFTPAELARLRDARPAGPPHPNLPQHHYEWSGGSSAAAPLTVVAGQRIHVGMLHAGLTVSIETGDTPWRFYPGRRIAHRSRPQPHQNRRVDQLGRVEPWQPDGSCLQKHAYRSSARTTATRRGI